MSGEEQYSLPFLYTGERDRGKSRNTVIDSMFTSRKQTINKTINGSNLIKVLISNKQRENI